MGNNDTPVPLCSESESNEWNGPEAELVEDDDAAEYEESHAGIKISYSLKKEEIYSCLKKGDSFKQRLRKSMIQAWILAVLFVFFCSAYFMMNKPGLLVCTIISVIFGILVAIMPFIDARIRASKFSTNNEINVEIYPDEIEVTNNKESYTIPLDGSCESEEIDGMLVILMPNDNLFIIPDRCLDPDFATDVQAIIIAGTSTRKED